MELKEIVAEINKTWNEMKSVLAQRDEEIKKLGTETAETKSMIEKLNTRIDELETKLNRHPLIGDNNNPQSSGKVKEVFFKWARKGAVGPEEAKALSVDDDTTGGYLAPEELVNEIIKAIVEYSPIRSVARVRTTSQRSVKIPRKTGATTAVWVAERATRTETGGPKFGMEEVPTHEMSAITDISVQDLEDNAFDLEGEITSDFAEQFGVSEGAAFVAGNGVGKPEGILAFKDLVTVKSGVADGFNGDSLIEIFYDLKSIYANNGSWLLNRQSLKKVRLLKDSTGNYIWQPNIGLGQPPTILERPYIEVPDMPDPAANAIPIAFGDWRRGYLIVDRVMISVQRDPYTQSQFGNVRFTARKRVGGQVILGEAIRGLKCSV